MTQTDNEQTFGGGVLEQWTKSPAANELAQILQALETIWQHIQTPLSPIKSIQRGITTEATTITIDAVDMTKAVVLSVGKKSEGYVAARGSLNMSGRATPTGAASNNWLRGEGANFSGSSEAGGTRWPYYDNSLSGSITGGTTDLTARQYSARLTSETTLQCDGAVEWQVIEYN